VSLRDIHREPIANPALETAPVLLFLIAISDLALGSATG
jgi:hypothetical protein